MGPVAELLGTIINSYKEFKDVGEKRDLLAQRITDLTGDICATVLRMQETNYSDQIGRLLPDLEKYAQLITRASRFIKEYDDQGPITHFAGRNQMQDEMDKLQQDLDLFIVRFGNNRLVDLCINQSMGAKTLQEVHDMAVAEKLAKWLKSPPEMTEKQHNTEQSRSQGTGQWFLEDKQFIEWEDNPGVLWIEGPSGAGKSVLSSTVIDNLFKQRAQTTPRSLGVAFFYFDFRTKETQSPEIALRRLILQLSAEAPHPHKTLDEHYNLSDGQKLPNYQDLVSLLLRLLKQLKRTYIVLDALDECDSTNFQQLVGLVAKLRAWAETPLHLFITSQTRPIFTENFEDINHIELHSEIMDQDINIFVTKELQTKDDLIVWQANADMVIEKNHSKKQWNVSLSCMSSYRTILLLMGRG
ncbi:HET-domain-containing protein [Mycena sanguinolenta]|uniref:HET-domain-containing protein n=1 Tax=Mycena sanguinolenta TaxID=230812 RepID=A0A8H6XXS2_9AGAR|nr:HET-domain-containing protein [Mycena sanguinolenta]